MKKYRTWENGNQLVSTWVITDSANRTVEMVQAQTRIEAEDVASDVKNELGEVGELRVKSLVQL